MVMIGPLLADCPGDIGACLDRAVEFYRSSRGVWIVHSHAEVMPRRNDVERWLRRRLQPVGTSEFEGVQVEQARIKSG